MPVKKMSPRLRVGPRLIPLSSLRLLQFQFLRMVPVVQDQALGGKGRQRVQVMTRGRVPMKLNQDQLLPRTGRGRQRKLVQVLGARVRRRTAATLIRNRRNDPGVKETRVCQGKGGLIWI